MTLEHTWLIKNQIQWNDMQVNCLREYNMYNLPPILDLFFVKNTNLLQSFLFVQTNSIFCNHIYMISIILIDISLTYKCIHIAWRRNQVLNLFTLSLFPYARIHLHLLSSRFNSDTVMSYLLVDHVWCPGEVDNL